jgi:hypothetical protein
VKKAFTARFAIFQILLLLNTDAKKEVLAKVIKTSSWLAYHNSLTKKDERFGARLSFFFYIIGIFY